HRLLGDAVCLAAEDPRTVLTQAPAGQQTGRALPDAVLHPAVAAALHPDAPWTCAEVAIRAFALYTDRPWPAAVIAPFASQHAMQLLLNADALAALHPDWTKQALTVAAAHAPTWVFRSLTQLMAVDPAWATQLIATVVSRHPALAFTHAVGLLAVD